MEPFKNLDDIRKYLSQQIDDCHEFVILKAVGKNGEVEDVRNASDEELPTYINSQSKAVQAIVKSRLSGKPVEIGKVLEELYDVEFDHEDYKQIGENDGQLMQIVDLCNGLGMTEESARAYEAVYAID